VQVLCTTYSLRANFHLNGGERLGKNSSPDSIAMSKRVDKKIHCATTVIQPDANSENALSSEVAVFVKE
jgi:hypothetical protein